MPKIDVARVPTSKGTGYPKEFQEMSKERLRKRLGDAGGLSHFGVNLTRLPPGNWSSQRHWHSHEDEFVYVIEGELVLIEDDGETTLKTGDCAAFPKGTGNGHHLVNRSHHTAAYIEIGSRQPEDITTCSDVDMKSANSDGLFVHKDGTPYAGQ
ncbi:MAG: cupin domain-containing protein [Pseudomonadota bacterium]